MAAVYDTGWNAANERAYLNAIGLFGRTGKTRKELLQAYLETLPKRHTALHGKGPMPPEERDALAAYAADILRREKK